MRRSLSVFEAKVRSQKLDRKKSFVRIATGNMYSSCHPRRLGFVRPEDSTSSGLMCVSTPMVMVARMMSPMTMAPWIMSVKKEILKPPSARIMLEWFIQTGEDRRRNM